MTGRVHPINKKPGKPLDKLSAQKCISEIAQDTSRIKYTVHVAKRMEERGFSVRDVERILLKGIIVDEPRLSEKGEWSYLVRYVGLEGRNREAGCATIIVKNKKLVIKTVEWIDP